jgi:hypothetical protein
MGATPRTDSLVMAFDNMDQSPIASQSQRTLQPKKSSPLAEKNIAHSYSPIIGGAGKNVNFFLPQIFE